MSVPPLNGFFCEKCKRVLGQESFYGSNNLEKYPEGKLHVCKECIGLRVDNWDPETYTWVLEECDVPYVPEEWNKLMQNYAKTPEKLTGKTILGKYLSKMRLKKWRDYRWQDSELLQHIEDQKVINTMKRLGYEASVIDQTVQTGRVPMMEPPPIPQSVTEVAVQPVEDYFEKQFYEDCASLGLTEEDQTYLRLKWGRGYKPEEWVSLEQLYVDMINSYVIETAGDINTLKLACKTSLKSNQLLDIGDIDGAQKATKMYDNLMKSGKWTAAQNKVKSEEDIDSIGELVAMCERQGFIPRYVVDGPQDKADRIIEDMQKYTHDLIANETNLNLLIERAGKQMAEEAERIAAAAKARENDETEEEKLFDYSTPTVSDNDMIELAEMIESEQLQDDEEADY